MAGRIVTPIIVFLVVSAVASPALAWLQNLLGLDPNVLRLTVFSTAVGAAVVWLLWRGALPYPAPMLSRPPWLGVGACLTFAVAMFALARIEGAPWRPPTATALGAPLAVVLITQLLGSAAEEVGWRGLVQPLLEVRLPLWGAMLITGALFGLGHFYLAFAVAPAAFLLFVVSAVAISVIPGLTTAGHPWRRRIVIATSLHFLLNMMTLFLFADGDGSVLYFGDLALASMMAAALAWMLVPRRRTARTG